MISHHLKIFISSTFQDMHDERQKLISNVFIKFRKLAKQRGVEVTEIELRTGVTVSSEDIAKVCLEQVDRCVDSPIFFIGILANYYGWDDWYESEEKESLKQSHKAIMDKYPKTSITELEIRYAIDNPKHNQAFFYVTEPTENEDKRLVALKEELNEYAKERDNLKFDYYESDEEFAQKVYDDLEIAFNKLYPPNQQLSEVEKLRVSHEAFALSRYKGYVRYDENEKILDKFLSSTNHNDRLLLYGKSGYGKSALVANYFKRFKKESDAFVIEHYIGGAGDVSSDFYAMLRRVMLEIKEEFSIEEDVPTKPEEIINEFGRWLQKVKRQTVVVLDGYNQIEDEVKERFLKSHLSKKFKNIKLIFTSIKSNYSIDNKHKIHKLSAYKQRELVISYLDLYGKRLTYDINELLQHNMTQNTLFLRTLLEEIRLLSVYETIGEDILEYLKARDVKELFIKIFKRYERDYDANLVKEILSLLYISRDGLSENNILEIIEKKTKIDRYKFYPIFLALEEHLVNRGGIYGFFHDYIKEAVYSYYLDKNNKENEYRKEMATYFEKKEINTQKVRELPYQLLKLKDRKRLYTALLNVDFFVSIQELDEYELLKYVQYIDKNKKYIIAEDLTEKLMLKKHCNEEDARLINAVASFLDVVYVYQYESQLLYEKSLILYKKLLPENHQFITICYNNLASIYDARGKHRKANKHYKLIVELVKKYHREMLGSVYNNFAGNYNEMGKYNKALKLYKKAAKIHKNKNNIIELALAYNNIAELYSTLGKYTITKSLHKKVLKIRKQYLDKKHPDVAISYGHLALVYEALNNDKKALKYHYKALEIEEEIYGNHHPHIGASYNNLAGYFYKKEKLNYALKLYKKSLKITKDILGKKHLEVAITYSNIGNVYDALSQSKKALNFYRKSLKIKENTLGEKHNIVAESYNNLAIFYYNKEKYNKAYENMKRAIKIWEISFPSDHPHLLNAYDGLEEIKEAKKQ